MPRHISILFPGQGSQHLGMLDNLPVELVESYRELALKKLDFDRNGRGPEPSVSAGIAAKGYVVGSRFVGKESLVEIQVENFSLRLLVTIPGVFLPPLGVALWASMRRDRCFVFPKDE